MSDFKNKHLNNLWTNVVPYLGGMCTTSEICELVKLFRECDDELSESVTFEHIKDLQDRNDILERTNESLLGANLDLATKKRQLEKDLDDAKKRLDYFTHSSDDWRSRAKHAEEEVEGLKKKLDFQQNDIIRLRKDRDRKDEAIAKLAEIRDKLQKERDSYHGLYTELKKDYDRLFEENKKLNARTNCLHVEVLWYRKHYKEKSDKTRELKSRLNSMHGDERIKKLQDGARDIGYKQGQTDLWDKLQNVNDVKPWNIASFYPDVTCMDDILGWDLEDFLYAYKSWQEKKEQERIDDMRGYLDWFCMGRACCKCPLRTDEFKCGRGIWFHDIADEDIQRYYKKVREYYRDDNK